jgi:hypothetical protein
MVGFLFVLAGLGQPAPGADLSKMDSAGLLARYQELRNVDLDGNRIASVENISFKKDAATFNFNSGHLYFLAPVGDKVVGAVFIGEGTFGLKPPTELERKQLARMNDGQTAVNEAFKELVMIFTDATFDELAAKLKFQSGSVPSKATSLWHSFHKKMREEFKNNIEARILADLCFPKLGSFSADIKGDRHGQLLFAVDLQDDEEVQLVNYKLSDFFDQWSSFHTEDTYKKGNKADLSEKDIVDTTDVNLDVSIERGEKLDANANIEFTALIDGPRVLNLTLAHTLRVSKVVDGSGAELKFIQEDKKKDGQFWVILPKPLIKGEKYTLKITYGGDEVIHNAGAGNYFVGARTSWYPKVRNASHAFGDRAMYKMKFQVPKDFVLVATGKPVRDYKEGKHAYSEWETQVPYTVVGFNYGKYQMKSQKDENLEVNVYANPGLGDELRQLQIYFEQHPEAARAAGVTTGGFNTTAMAKNAAIQAFNSVRLFSQYFGEIPFKNISVTQQPAGFFGQSWPTLVFMPYTAFLDSTTRHQLQLSRSARSRQFFEEVGSHEVAHQWWGHIVGWKSYHDQWLSEGFAQFSAGLYVHRVEGEKKFKEFLELERQRILEKMENGQRLTDAGPIWMGQRLSWRKARGAYQLVYPKGGYILHMLRMMLHEFQKSSDERFIKMMRDFVQTYYNKDASTEDFKAIVDKHFGQNMDWFFNQWVYGTEVPKVSVRYNIANNNGKYQVKGDITQKNVSSDFKMLLPVIIRFKGNRFAAGKIAVQGETTPFSTEFPEKPESVEFNPLHAMLCELEIKK